MKKFLWIIVIALIAAGGYIYYDPKLRAYFERETGKMLHEAKQTKMYKWKDNQGQWQLSSEPPPPGTNFELIEYHSDTNVMPKEFFTGKEKD